MSHALLITNHKHHHNHALCCHPEESLATHAASASSLASPVELPSDSDINEHANSPKRPQRLKIWQLETELHCSIIGTCVPLDELRRIYKRVRGKQAKALDDYELHSLFVSGAASPHAGIRLINKYLERAHRIAIQHFNQAKTECELDERWREALTTGDVPGAYWALQTHPYVTRKLVNLAFNEVHMLSHLAGRNVLEEKRRRQSLNKQNDELKQQLAETRQRLQTLHSEHNQTLTALQQQQLQLRIQSEQSKKLEQQCDALQDTAISVTLEAKLNKIERQLAISLKDCQQWQTKYQALNEENAQLKSQLQDQPNLPECQLMQAHPDMPLADQQQVGYCDAAKQDPDLCGRCILYVGGHARARARFRQRVEKLNGKYLQHDGGMEDSRKRLPVLLQRADAVVCPLDCISHRAIDDIKSLCKREEKPMLLVRNASLSAFNDALSDIAQ